MDWVENWPVGTLVANISWCQGLQYNNRSNLRRKFQAYYALWLRGGPETFPKPLFKQCCCSSAVISVAKKANESSSLRLILRYCQMCSHFYAVVMNSLPSRLTIVVEANMDQRELVSIGSITTENWTWYIYCRRIYWNRSEISFVIPRAQKVGFCWWQPTTVPYYSTTCQHRQQIICPCCIGHCSTSSIL